MASLISAATGNFTASGSWGLVDTTSYLDSESNSQPITTANTDSQTFAPGAITVDGLAVKLASRSASPSGTFTVILWNSTAGSAVASVTCNVSDLPSSGNGWIFVLFGVPQLLLAATNYLVRATASVNGQVSLYRGATGQDISRMLRTTTSQAPAAGDQLVVCGAVTGAGAITAVTITMDNTATTSFGPTVSGGPPQGIVVSLGGTLTWGVAASTAYYLKWKGIMLVAGGGVVNVGTSGARIPSTSTAVLECDSAVNVDTGIQVIGGTFGVYGPVQTNMWTLLTADVAVAGTVLTVGSTAGWVAGDVLALAPTTRTPSEAESKTILTVDSPTQVTLAAGVTNAHGGNSTTGVQAEVLNLTQAVKIRGISSSLNGFFFASAAAAVHVEQCEMTNLGSGTANKLGISLQGSCTSAVFTYCSVHDSTGSGQWGFDLQTGTASSTTWLSLQHIVMYNIEVVMVYAPTSLAVGSGMTMDDLVLVRTISNIAMILRFSDNQSMSNIRVSGSISHGVQLAEPLRVTITGIAVHSCGANGILVSGQDCIASIVSPVVWRNNSSGINVSDPFGVYSSTSYLTPALSLSGGVFFGNNPTGLSIPQGIHTFCSVLITGCVFNAGTTLVQSYGVQATGVGNSFIAPDGIIINSSNFGQTTPHPVSDISLGNSGQIVCNNCLFATTPVIASPGNPLGYIKCQHYSSGPDDNRAIMWHGVDQTDSVIFRTSAPSERLTPNANSSSVIKLLSGDKAIPVGAGQTATVTVYVRTSVVGDGSAYSGAAPRLMLRQNDAAGVTSLTVLGTLVGGSGAFAAITAACPVALENCTLRVYVDCNGTAGWVNVDDWSVAVA